MNATIPINTPVAETAPSKPRGFAGIKCPLCGEDDCVRLDLHDVGSFVCTSCDGEFTADDARAWAERWLAVLTWCDLAPVIE